jgi:hypothetical protein
MKEFEDEMKQAFEDWKADNCGDECFIDGQSAAVDLADAALFNPQILKFCQKQFRTTNRERLKYIVAEYICG